MTYEEKLTWLERLFSNDPAVQFAKKQWRRIFLNLSLKLERNLERQSMKYWLASIRNDERRKTNDSWLSLP